MDGQEGEATIHPKNIKQLWSPENHGVPQTGQYQWFANDLVENNINNLAYYYICTYENSCYKRCLIGEPN